MKKVKKAPAKKKAIVKKTPTPVTTRGVYNKRGRE